MARITFYFNDIIDSYDKWREMVSSKVLTNEEFATMGSFDQWAYNLLARYFRNVNVRYTVPDAFISQLINVYENRFRQFAKQKQIIDEIYNLSMDDLLLVNTALSNYASNPNNLPENPTQPLDYITSQSYSQLTDNKLRAYIDSINRVPSLRVDEFLRGRNKYFDEINFLDLFMNLQIDEYNIYGV